MAQHNNPHDYRAIQNTLATYCIALDETNFSLFEDIFVDDVEAQYPFSSEQILGKEALAKRIKQRLNPVTTQHALTTQTIVVGETGREAKALTYFTGVHLGRGKWEGQMVTAYGKYIDDLVCTGGEAQVLGASGKWLIKRREVVFFGRVGEEGVMRGEDD